MFCTLTHNIDARAQAKFCEDWHVEFRVEHLHQFPYIMFVERKISGETGCLYPS